MRGGVEGTAGPDQRPRADGDETGVEPGAVEVDVGAFSESWGGGQCVVQLLGWGGGCKGSHLTLNP